MTPVRPTLSIITITYKAADTLPATMDSIDEQVITAPLSYEHIIIDGAGDTETARIARSTSNIHRFVISEPDKGLYDAMNKGIRESCGSHLLFLNAGDTFSGPDVLEKYMLAAANNDADIVYADTQLVDARRRIVGPRHLSVPERLTFKSFARGMLVCHQAFCINRKLVEEYNLNYRFSADYEWCLRCLQKSSPERCINLHTVAINYLTDGITDKNHKASLKERYRIMCDYYGSLPTALRHIGFALRAMKRKLIRK